MPGTLCLCLTREFGQAQSHQHAVDGPALAVLAQQCQKFAPAPRITRLVRVLGRITTRRVEQNRLVGEPPVAVAGAPDTTQRFLTKLLRQWEVESRIDDGRGLPGSRRPDDDVPGQLVESGPVGA